MWEIIDEPVPGYEFLDGIFATPDLAHKFAIVDCCLQHHEYEITEVMVYNTVRGFETRFVVVVEE